MNIKNSVLDYIRYKQLNWYGHERRINKERLPQKKLDLGEKEDLEMSTWKKNRTQEVTSGMREKEINNME